MDFSPQDIDKVSLVARLCFTPDERDQIAAQLERIANYLDACLADSDTSDVAPLVSITGLAGVFADDVVRPSCDREAILANAPKRDDECYLVPAIFGE